MIIDSVSWSRDSYQSDSWTSNLNQFKSHFIWEELNITTHSNSWMRKGVMHRRMWKFQWLFKRVQKCWILEIVWTNFMTFLKFQRLSFHLNVSRLEKSGQNRSSEILSICSTEAGLAKLLVRRPGTIVFQSGYQNASPPCPTGYLKYRVQNAAGVFIWMYMWCLQKCFDGIFISSYL